MTGSFEAAFGPNCIRLALDLREKWVTILGYDPLASALLDAGNPCD